MLSERACYCSVNAVAETRSLRQHLHCSNTLSQTAFTLERACFCSVNAVWESVLLHSVNPGSELSRKTQVLGDHWGSTVRPCGRGLDLRHLWIGWKLRQGGRGLSRNRALQVALVLAGCSAPFCPPGGFSSSATHGHEEPLRKRSRERESERESEHREREWAERDDPEYSEILPS